MEEQQNTEEIKQEEKEEVQENNNDLEQKLAALQKEADENNDRLKRVMAEFENFKKRNQKEREMQYSSILADIVGSLLPVIDNLEKAVQTNTEDAQFKQGIELVHKQLLDVLNTFGVKKIEAVGNRFDPELHDAVSHVEDENLGEQIVKEEFRTGYIIGDKVIRHSMVVVAN